MFKDTHIFKKLATFLLVMLLFSFCGSKVKNRVLFDFETDGELNRLNWKCYSLFSLSRHHATHGVKSLKMEFFPSDYPQLLTKTKRNDWRGFSLFRFDVFNPQKRDVQITVRIDDRKKYPAYGDRYSKSLILHPGKNIVTIPLETLKTSVTERNLELQSIYRFFIYKAQPKEKIILYVDNIRLIEQN